VKLTDATTSVPDRADPAVRGEDGNLTNRARAEFGRAAVDVGTPDRGFNDARTDAIDTLANIAHWLAANGSEPRAAFGAALDHFEDEVETVEERTVQILTDAGLDTRLHHTGGGIWVAEVRSEAIPGRHVWVTDSEGDEAGPFLVGAYPDAEGQAWVEHLSGACTEAELVDRVRRGLTEPA